MAGQAETDPIPTLFFLARIFHKDRCERPESAVNAGLQRQKAH
jgi:hypothetical protein